MTALTISLMQGVHDDPRLAGLPVLYGLGSYIPHPIPATFAYLYILLRNDGPHALNLADLWLETDDGRPLRQIDLPMDAVRRHQLLPGTSMALGFLRHLLSRCLRHNDRLVGRQTLRARVATTSGGRACSDALTLDIDYPTQPLEDVELLPYADFFLHRAQRVAAELARIRRSHGSLRDYADLHTHWGVRRDTDEAGNPCWTLREYMPAATQLWLTTDKLKFQRWATHAYRRLPDAPGWWELRLPQDALEHGTYMELRVASPLVNRAERRVPATARWVEQDRDHPGQWCARFWNPPQPYVWQHPQPPRQEFPRIYEAHVGMAQAAQGRASPRSVGSFQAFARDVLPYVAEAGYTAVQLMGVVEHPLYKSFGYQISSYFATTSRCGVPDDFKALVDAAHGLGLSVILDIPHSHASPNTEQGIARYDTSAFLFADKDNQWGTLSFDYSKEMTRRFLLSNCRFWQEEYRIDGFRFDAVGNMIYQDHGFGDDFSHVGRCFYTLDGQPRADEDGILYLCLANTLLHELSPDATTIAEEFSGMPGVTTPPDGGGLGFDYRFAMGIPDFWAKYIKEGRGMGPLWHEMTHHRRYDNTVSYMECHDQSINGKDAMIWRLMGDAMYSGMGRTQQSWPVSRGMALYKLMRLVTLATAHRGYLNFMGAEFGHPEWLDDAEHAHRQWHLAHDPDLKYSQLAAFDRDCLRHLVAGHVPELRHDPFLRLLHEGDRLLAFERGRLLLAFNFHEKQAQQAVNIMATPGKYVEAQSTDAPAYGGYGNLLAQGLEHFSDAHSGVNEQRVTLYLPPLTALVLIREE